MKECKQCHEIKDESEFYTYKYVNKEGIECIKYIAACKECKKNRSKTLCVL